jgi:hypothetical protein
MMEYEEVTVRTELQIRKCCLLGLLAGEAG